MTLITARVRDSAGEYYTALYAERKNGKWTSPGANIRDESVQIIEDDK